MTDEAETNYRMKRVECLLRELEYEITRGMMERELDEHLGYRFVVPNSKNIPKGVVMCEFRTRPVPLGSVWLDVYEPKLRIVK